VSSLAEVVSEAAKLLGDRIKDSSAEMSEGIKLDVELKNKTNLITYALQKIESLTKVERFRAIRKIKSEPDSVLTFWDLKEDEREEWEVKKLQNQEWKCPTYLILVGTREEIETILVLEDNGIMKAF
ncbi:hypothetical protein Tco_0365111, partial [Tanacetum coccineum]